MEGRYTGNHAICETGGRSLHYPDLGILKKDTADTVRKRSKRIISTHSSNGKTRKKYTFSPNAAAFYRKRLIQLLLIAVVLTFIFGSIGVHADPIETACSEDELVYKVITVEKGDTLWKIADTWFESTGDSIRTYIDNVKVMNHLHGDQIQEGQLLLIYYRNAAEEILAVDGI